MSEKDNENNQEDYLSTNSILTSTLNPPLNEHPNVNHKNRNIFVIILFIIVLLLAANQYFGWIVPKNLNDAITSQSIIGQQGERGPAGKDGIIGKDGAPGARGSQGLPGPQGPAGPAGTQGTSGSTGATGATGATGPTGPAGTGGTGGNGTGTVTLGTCDSDITVSVSSKYVPYSGTIANNWVVDVLTISNIDGTACNGKRVTVVLLQSNGSVIVTSNQLTISGTSLVFNCTPDASGACTGGGFPSTPILRSNLLDSVTLEVAA
jgi:hypothetical protein